MAEVKRLPSVERLHALFEVNESGELFYKPRGEASFDANHAGARAGIVTRQGYVRVKVRGTTYAAHRVVWKMMTGREPKYIDHINGIRGDNRIENLRDLSHADNQRNLLPRGGASKFKGVYRAKHGKWGARIRVNNITTHLGTYTDETEVARAYDVASIKLHGDLGVTNKSLGLY